jgi:hypothetical protein
MDHLVPSELPTWLQLIFSGFAGIGILLAALQKYRKAEQPKETKSDHMVLSATLADGQAIKDLVKVMGEVENAVTDMKFAIGQFREQYHMDSTNTRSVIIALNESMLKVTKQLYKFNQSHEFGSSKDD